MATLLQDLFSILLVLLGCFSVGLAFYYYYKHSREIKINTKYYRLFALFMSLAVCCFLLILLIRGLLSLELALTLLFVFLIPIFAGYGLQYISDIIQNKIVLWLSRKNENRQGKDKEK